METFDELIIEHDSGQLNAGLSRKMRELMDELHRHARDNGKAEGEITLKVKFKAANNGRVDIKTATNVKGPGLPATSETRWIGPKGTLEAQDPRQTVLPMTTRKRDHVSQER